MASSSNAHTFQNSEEGKALFEAAKLDERFAEALAQGADKLWGHIRDAYDWAKTRPAVESTLPGQKNVMHIPDKRLKPQTITLDDVHAAMENRVRTGNIDPQVSEKRLSELRERAKNYKPHRPSTTVRRDELELVSKEITKTFHIVGAGMSYLIAGLTALSAWSQLRSGIKTDETTGEKQYNSSALSIAAIEGLLTAGMLYMGIKSTQKAMGR